MSARPKEGEAAIRRYKRYPAYKDSGVEWLGAVPEHWNLRRLRATVTACQNGVWGDEPDGVHDTPCVRVADFDRTALRIDFTDPTMRSIAPAVVAAKRLRAGDLLLEKSGGGENQPVGTVVLYDHDTEAVSSNFIARMPVAVGHSSRFLTYLHAAMYGARINTRSIKQNTGIQNLDSEAYLNERVALPNLSEQHAIASFLDRETARIDALVAKREKLVELLNEKRSALITRLVTTGLGPNLSTKQSGLDSVGRIPGHWKVKPLTKYVVEKSDYRGKTPEKVNDGVFLVTARNVKMGMIDYECSQEFVSTSDYDEIMRRGLPKRGDLLFTTEAPLGNVAIVDREDIALAQRIIRFRMNPQHFDSRFVMVAMMSHYFQFQLQTLATGSTAQGLKASKLPMLRVIAPPLAEQQEIFAVLEAETERIRSLIAHVEAAITRILEMRTALISAAVTGKIDVRDHVRLDLETEMP